ncbi:hypothetical protein MK786_15435 [Microbacterium sp. CFH 31415]|uniref:hypothetical protein n=1 Tax=Microbacterium sp. CFH 31415 TaxID=2921732 RepID=UPI001F139F18|nr:hypothetical protein [Microbacterium sp. CFH 31415]MCH6232144.1 hypothetical protein [Microbacterium sp. CFH 31415]
MPFDAELLLSGPRGRRLCFEYARACADDTQAGRDASAALFWAAHLASDPADRGTLLTIGDGAAPEPPPAGPREAAAALRSVTLPLPTQERLREALGASVDRAMYWQRPDGEDLLAATPEVSEALRPIAELIAASPGAQWWTTPVAVDDQWAAPWDGAGRAPDDLTGSLNEWHRRTMEDEEHAARERASDPNANWSGIWWSIPPHDLVRTTRSLGRQGPARLWFEEDSFGDDSAVATPVEAYPARVIEITGPEDWADLCRRHPLDVSAARRHDWFRVTGRVGAWTIPDWRSVAVEADAVHLTVLGYLTTATRPIELDDERATVLAGWNPDETFWFRGTLDRPAEAVRWERHEDEWRAASPV